jgi:hypothetical protein
MAKTQKNARGKFLESSGSLRLTLSACIDAIIGEDTPGCWRRAYCCIAKDDSYYIVASIDGVASIAFYLFVFRDC